MLEAFGAVLVVPITDTAHQVSGLVMLGEKRSEEPYAPSDWTLLTAVARQVGVVRENLLLRRRVHEDRQVQREMLVRFERDHLTLMRECPACGRCFDSHDERCTDDGSELRIAVAVERTLDGKYRLERAVGRGGMGAVYEATDLRLDRRVAVKFMLGHRTDHETQTSRFMREARMAARLSHPNVVAIYDYGAAAGTGPYLVMELARGATLRAEIDRAGRLPLDVVATCFDQILDGISAAHALGIVHRDLKPDNVLVARADGSLQIKILDFGLAKQRTAEDDATRAGLTLEGAVVGTPGYMAPEQLAGLDVDERTDLFAVGIMVVEALTGRRPFARATYADTLRSALHDEMRLTGSSDYVRRLDEILKGCLAKDRRARVRSADALRRQLIPLLRACPASAFDDATVSIVDDGRPASAWGAAPAIGDTLTRG